MLQRSLLVLQRASQVTPQRRRSSFSRVGPLGYCPKARTTPVTCDVTPPEETLTSVFTYPGLIAFTLMGARSTAKPRVMDSTAPIIPAASDQPGRGLTTTDPI